MKTREKIKSWVIDYGYMIHGALSSLVYITPPKHYLGHVVDGKVPVIIIPGVLGRWSFLKKLADTISLLGHPVYVVKGLGYNLYTIPDSSKLVESIIQREHLKDVIIVAHSKGGLIGKHVLIHHNQDNNVIGMITIATPYSGSAMAKLVPLDPIKELHNDSQIIKDINAHTSVNDKIISISPLYDNHVWAEKGSFLDGAKNITVQVHGHHKIVYDQSVIDLVKDSVEELTLSRYMK
jgi:pimeloyl-ACP methyl ester carboxylesterase